MSLSRRDFFKRFLPKDSEDAPIAPAELEVGSCKAIVQGRFCLAYQSMSCSVCYERCPEVGAIVMENMLPRVIADKCTGCKVCYDVCPAPTNAILLMAPKPN